MRSTRRTFRIPPGGQVYNTFNNMEFKSYNYTECAGKAHEGDVRQLIYEEDHTILISASGDGSISMHDDAQVSDESALCARASVVVVNLDTQIHLSAL